LDPDLTSIAVDGAARVCEAESSTALACREEASTNTANQRADEMSVEDIEGIVNVLEDGKMAFAEIKGDLSSMRNIIDGLQVIF
jgi:hypothetical protein